MRAARTLVIAGAGLAAAWVACAGAAGASAVDLTGVIAGGTGAFRHATGRVSIAVGTSPPGASAVVARLSAPRCVRRRHCVLLRGAVRGTPDPPASPGLPDTGSTIVVHMTGRLAPLGAVRATGTIRCPGNIARGTVTMSLEVRQGASTLRVEGQSGPVPGFTCV